MATDVKQQSIIAWVQLSQQLALLGINAAAGIRNAVKAMQPDVTDEQLNAIVQSVIDDATRRKQLAQADAAGQGPQPPANKTTPIGSPAPHAGPTGTDGVTGTPTANNAPPAPAGEHGPHSHVDRPQGGVPGTKSA